MSYNKQMKDLNNFLLDINCLEPLNKYIDRVNIFKILKTNKQEIRHSNFLAWLLNPYENHKLKDKFLYLFLSDFFKNNQDIKNIQDWMLLDMTTAEVTREAYYENKNDYLDIVIEFADAKKVIAIENKIFSKENKKNNSSQTILYRQNIEEKFKGYDCLFIYLTPLGDFPDDDKWGVMTYTQISDIVKNIIDNYIDNSYIKLLLENYIEILGDGIVENNELIKICNEIYKKHKNALDLIYANKIDGSAVVANFLKELLLEINDEYSNIIYKEKFDSGVTYVRFTTRYLDNYLGEYKKGSGAWAINQNPKQRYFYEFWVRELKNEDTKKLKLNLVLSMKDLEETDYNKNRKICDMLGNKRKLGKGTAIANNEKFTIIENAIEDVSENYNNEEFRTDIKNKIKEVVNNIEQKIMNALKKENNNLQ